MTTSKEDLILKYQGVRIKTLETEMTQFNSSNFGHFSEMYWLHASDEITLKN